MLPPEGRAPCPQALLGVALPSCFSGGVWLIKAVGGPPFPLFALAEESFLWGAGRRRAPPSGGESASPAASVQGQRPNSAPFFRSQKVGGGLQNATLFLATRKSTVGLGAPSGAAFLPTPLSRSGKNGAPLPRKIVRRNQSEKAEPNGGGRFEPLAGQGGCRKLMLSNSIPVCAIYSERGVRKSRAAVAAAPPGKLYRQRVCGGGTNFHDAPFELPAVDPRPWLPFVSPPPPHALCKRPKNFSKEKLRTTSIGGCFASSHFRSPAAQRGSRESQKGTPPRPHFRLKSPTLRSKKDFLRLPTAQTRTTNFATGNGARTPARDCFDSSAPKTILPTPRFAV